MPSNECPFNWRSAPPEHLAHLFRVDWSDLQPKKNTPKKEVQNPNWSIVLPHERINGKRK